MIISGLKHQDKITTHRLKLVDKVIYLDFGSEDIKLDDLKDIDYIFISHCHYDHTEALYKYIDTLSNVNHKVKILMTTTTLKILLELIERDSSLTLNVKEKKRKDLYNLTMEVTYDDKVVLDNNLSVTFFQAGHMYGASMIYLESNAIPDTSIRDNTYKEEDNKSISLLYTGDMDYCNNDFYRSYYLPNKIKVDYLIVDSTSFISKYSYKKGSASNFDPLRKQIQYINIKPEKAIFYAMREAKKYAKDGVFFIYDLNLAWLPLMLEEMGYPCFGDTTYNNVVVSSRLDDKDYLNHMVILSNNKNDSYYNGNFNSSLHISLNDFNEFLYNYIDSNLKVLLSHYDLESINDYIKLCNEYSYSLLKEGSNEL